MKKIAYVKNCEIIDISKFTLLNEKFDTVFFRLEDITNLKYRLEEISLVILESASDLKKMLRSLYLTGSPLHNFKHGVLFVHTIDEETRNLALQYGLSELFQYTDDEEKILLRLNYLLQHTDISLSKGLKRKEFKIPFIKRAFDIVFSLLAILFLSPVFMLVGLLIRLGSPGPVIYNSKRVGAQYKVFNFYKFRSMRFNADQSLKDVAHLNQYKQQPAQNDITCDRCTECMEHDLSCPSKLYLDNEIVCEKIFLMKKKREESSAFVKIQDDPRLTKIGKFIRNTSIDELPQLFNVLKGDMSIVGNRPLPLYEAEKITTDKYSERFIAPAGITGLWQVTKRGKGGKMSEEERIELDNTYARNFSFLYDVKIILKTIPALIQKENV